MPVPAPAIIVPSRETRAIMGLELREAGKDQLPTIVGYAAVFEAWSEPLGYGRFREKIRKGAFTKSLSRGDDVRAMVDHNSSMIIGRRSAMTLTLTEDTRGLAVEILPANTSAGRDVVESVRRKDITGMSFGFETVKDEWEYASDANDTVNRTLVEVNLFDVSVTAFPAYPDTEVATRSLKAMTGREAERDADMRLRLRLAEVG